jgi:DNA-binding NarL/FixJ family response regulator
LIAGAGSSILCLHMPCRVFIADDVQALRVLWRQFLEEDEEIEVVGEAGDGREALAGVARTKPDVLVLDLSMPHMDGLEVIRVAAREHPDTKIVVASGFAESRLGPLALELGASAYFEKGGTAERLRELVHEACDAPSHRIADSHRSTDG